MKIQRFRVCSYLQKGRNVLGTIIIILLTSKHLLMPQAVSLANSTSFFHIHMHAIIPEHFALSEELKAFYINSFFQFRRNRLYANVFRTFYVSNNITVLRHDNPSEILSALCRDVLGAPTVTLLTINNPGIARRNSASSYILQLVHTTGIPVITWDPEYCGLSKVK